MSFPFPNEALSRHNRAAMRQKTFRAKPALETASSASRSDRHETGRRYFQTFFISPDYGLPHRRFRKENHHMRFSQRILLAAVAAMAMVVPAGVAVAHGFNGGMTVSDSRGYSGTWPVTVTRSQFHNGTYCLTLSGNGRSGSASVVMGSEKYPYGTFVIVNHIFMATIVKPSGSQNGALTFTASASRGNIGQGIFENIEGGSNFDFGSLAFGTKGGC
jgi:hypothetical protein